MDFKRFSFLLFLCVCTPFAFADGLRDAFDHYKRNPGGSFSNDEMRGWVGPSFHARNNSVNPRLVTARMPSWNAGCGGIDFFSGSFAAVTKDEIVQMARGIAAGAPGYFFNLAIASVCPSCQEQMADLQQKLEKWNQLTMDSCTRAWDFVESETNWIGSQDKKGGIFGTEKDALSGLIPDYSDPLTSRSTKEKRTKSESEETEANAMAEVTIAKTEAAASAEFIADASIPELYMSIFGTSVMDAVDLGDGKYDVNIDSLPPTFDFKKALYNRADDNVTLRKCAVSLEDDPKCIQTSTKDIVFEGIVVRNRRLITNESATPEDLGILQKIRANIAYSQEQQNFINNTRYPYYRITTKFKDNPNLLPTAGEELALRLAKTQLTEFYTELKDNLINAAKEGNDITAAEKALILESITNADTRFNAAISSIDREIATINESIALQSALKNLVNESN